MFRYISCKIWFKWRKNNGPNKLFLHQKKSPNGVAVDSVGNIYFTGFTSGALEGANSGSNDIFLIKYSSDGPYNSRNNSDPQEMIVDLE